MSNNVEVQRFEAVCQALERCIDDAYEACGECSYKGNCIGLKRDALDLIKVQSHTISELRCADEIGELVRCVKAKWIVKRNSPWASCSNCGHSFRDVYDIENYDAFCRHCGAIMEGIVSE